MNWGVGVDGLSEEVVSYNWKQSAGLKSTISTASRAGTGRLFLLWSSLRGWQKLGGLGLLKSLMTLFWMTPCR